MENKQRVILLSAVPYAFKAENGVTYTGVSLSFLETDSMKPHEGEKGARGYSPMKSSIPEALCGSVKDVPAIYDVTFKLTSDPKKGLIAKVTDLTYVRDCITPVKAS